jgi:hypothetical protein
MKHPAWKRTYVLKCARLREQMGSKGIHQRIGVPPGTQSQWIHEARLGRKKARRK